jgi:hypothetical protein
VLSSFYPIEEITVEKMGLLMAGVSLDDSVTDNVRDNANNDITNKSNHNAT